MDGGRSGDAPNEVDGVLDFLGFSNRGAVGGVRETQVRMGHSVVIAVVIVRVEVEERCLGEAPEEG